MAENGWQHHANGAMETDSHGGEEEDIDYSDIEERCVRLLKIAQMGQLGELTMVMDSKTRRYAVYEEDP